MDSRDVNAFGAAREQAGGAASEDRIRVTAGLSIHVNGREHAVVAAPSTRLLHVLRNDLALNGPKYGCGLGECGACAVLVEGRAVRSCTVPVSAMAGRTITTLEGLGTVAQPHPVQAAFVAENAAQCGYCLNGMIMATAALLAREPSPDEAAIRRALRHHLCRCGTHVEILKAVRRAARAMGGVAAPADAVPEGQA